MKVYNKNGINKIYVSTLGYSLNACLEPKHSGIMEMPTNIEPHYLIRELNNLPNQRQYYLAGGHKNLDRKHIQNIDIDIEKPLNYDLICGIEKEYYELQELKVKRKQLIDSKFKYYLQNMMA